VRNPSHDYFGNLRRNRNPYETTAGRYQLTRAEGHHSRERASNLHSLDGLRIIYELESNTHKLSANSESFFVSALIEVSDFSTRKGGGFFGLKKLIDSASVSAYWIRYASITFRYLD
jgi:hypothetical protein